MIERKDIVFKKIPAVGKMEPDVAFIYLDSITHGYGSTKNDCKSTVEDVAQASVIEIFSHKIIKIEYCLTISFVLFINNMRLLKVNGKSFTA